MNTGINDFKNLFFIGVAGVGMSAVAQYLSGIGKNVSGSDRYFVDGEFNETKSKLEAEGIKCFLQNGEGITNETDLVVVSTAIEDTVGEVQKAKQLNIPIIKRSELLALIAKSKRTIAIGGTSGKSTVSAMLYDILEFAGLYPSIISGAGLVNIIKDGKIGNAKVSKGEWLVIETDESDGSIVQYQPEIGVLLNVDKDHQEIDELVKIFAKFKNNSKKFIVNQSNDLSKKLSQNIEQDFSVDENSNTGFIVTDFKQDGFSIEFKIRKSGVGSLKSEIRNQDSEVRHQTSDIRLQSSVFKIKTIGRHNMENALAAVAVANQIGVDLETCAAALQHYQGIFRRHQVLGNKNGVWVIDDYAHNPVKCSASIAACQQVAAKVVAWFQPHGYGPTKFLRKDFVHEISKALRPEDEIWMSEIFYAGGTAVKDISANDLINDIKQEGKNAFFVKDRNDFLNAARPHLSDNCVLLLMGARDSGLEYFAKEVFEKL